MTAAESQSQSVDLGPLLDHEKLIQFGVLGDAEPKPDPVFDNLRAAIDIIETVHEQRPFEFMAGIGDLPHNGKLRQYEALSGMFQRLTPPLYPILGNEELPGTDEDVDRFLEFATQWNDGSPSIETTQYTLDVEGVRFVFASADTDGKNLSPAEADWIQRQLDGAGDRPVVLFIHTPPPGVFERGREMSTDTYERIADHDNLSVVFSGHSHMNLDLVEGHVTDEWGTHHVHVPGLERTKVGDTHIPRLRLAVITPQLTMEIETFNLETEMFEPRHRVSIPLR